MSLSSLSSKQLSRLIELVEEKEKLQSQIAKIDRTLNQLDGQEPAAEQSDFKPRAGRGARKRRGALKTALLAKLQSAGKQGLTTKELTSALGAKAASIYAWFYTTGKKVKGIKKVGRAKFAYLPK